MWMSSFSIRSQVILVWFESVSHYSLTESDSFGAKTNTYIVSADVKRAGAISAGNEE